MSVVANRVRVIVVEAREDVGSHRMPPRHDVRRGTLRARAGRVRLWRFRPRARHRRQRSNACSFRIILVIVEAGGTRICARTPISGALPMVLGEGALRRARHVMSEVQASRCLNAHVYPISATLFFRSPW